MVRFHLKLLSACDRAAQTISRTALLSLGLLTLATGFEAVLGAAVAPAHAMPEFKPFVDASVMPRPNPVLADATPEAIASTVTDFTPIKLAAVNAVPLLRATSAPLQDGTYLFGESSLPDQVDKAYMVFQVAGKRVSGAVYWPHSSYDCFEGRFNQDRLALRVKATYSGEIYEQALAIAPDFSGALASDVAMAQPGLEGMHRFESMTENDSNILASCQAAL